MGLNTLKKNTISYKKFKKKELKFKVLKVLTCNFNLHVNIKVYGNLLLYISQEKLDQNRCFISGNSSSVYKPWNISRNFLRKLIDQKQIFGLKKASW